jgi:DNA (cytosine-5)-methyltransferase 1
MKKLNFVDIFCGAGGLSHSFKKRRHNLNLAIDIDETSNACKILKSAKYPISSNFLIISLAFDLIPTTFSINIYLGLHNSANLIKYLYNSFLGSLIIFCLLAVLNPWQGGPPINKSILLFSFRILQALDFGVPQNRKRLFFFGIKKNINQNYVENFFKFLEFYKSKSKKFLLKDALFGLRPLKPKKFKNDTKNEYFESGFNIERINEYRPNTYLKIINSNKNIKYTYNHFQI